MTTPVSTAGTGAEGLPCIVLGGCNEPIRCTAERFCCAYLDDLRSEDVIDTATDDLTVLRGWSGLPCEEAATAGALDRMPRWRFHEAVARLAKTGHVRTGIFGQILGLTPAGRLALASSASARPGVAEGEGGGAP